MENLSRIVKKPRLLLSNNDPNQVVSYDMIAYHFKAKRVNHSLYDIQISDIRDFGFDDIKCFQKLALFLQQNIFIYSLSFHFDVSFSKKIKYFDRYILPVLSQHPGLRSLEFRNYHPVSPIPLCSFLFYNTRLTQFSLNNSIIDSKDLNIILNTFFDNYPTNFAKLSICRLNLRLNHIDRYPLLFCPSDLQLLGIEFKNNHDFTTLLSNEILENLSVGYFSNLNLSDRIALIIKIATHSTLRTLQFYDTTVPAESSAFFITALKNNICRLESIKFDRVDVPLFDLLHSLSTNTHLTHLEYLGSNSIPSNYSLLPQFTNNQTLKTLKISRFQFDILGVEELGKIVPHLQSLTQLNLDRMEFTAGFCEKIAHMTNLRSLSLNYGYNQAETFHPLLSHLTNLESLTLKQAIETYETARDIATHITHNTSLRSLKLGISKMISPLTLVITKSLSQNNHLVDLNLGNATIDAEGLVAVFSSNVKRFFIKRLSHIDLATYYYQIFQALEGNSTLKKISCLQYISMPYTDTILDALLQLIINNKTIQTFNLFEIRNPRCYLRINHTLYAHNTTITKFHTTLDHTFSHVMYRNRMIYESRKHHQRTTLYELLLPVLRI